MNIVELFAGSRSFSKVAERLGHQTFTSDIEAFDNIDYVTDIFDFDTSKVPFQIDVLWASPPCTYFSVASIGHHWNKDNTPKTENAKLGIEIVKKTMEIISELNPKYCQYGDKRAKPTDIWTNIEQWIPRPVCHNGNKNCHHESAPRGSKTGTQGLKGSYDRSKVPEQLCLEILNTIRDKP